MPVKGCKGQLDSVFIPYFHYTRTSIHFWEVFFLNTFAFLKNICHHSQDANQMFGQNYKITIKCAKSKPFPITMSTDDGCVCVPGASPLLLFNTIAPPYGRIWHYICKVVEDYRRQHYSCMFKEKRIVKKNACM